MVYCNECAEWFGFPETMNQRRATCGFCGWEKTCNEVPESELPKPKTKRVPPWHASNEPRRPIHPRALP
jgi:hypothetical protein